MVRHHTFNVGIMGSNPIASTINPSVNREGAIWPMGIQGAQTSRVGKPPAGKLPLLGPVAQLVRSRELIILRPLFESRRDYQWSNGGIGRRNALKMHRCKTCQFKSDFDYHAIHSARGLNS